MILACFPVPSYQRSTFQAFSRLSNVPPFASHVPWRLLRQTGSCALAVERPSERDVLLDAATLAVDESDQPWTGVVLRLMLGEILQAHYRIAVNVLLETAREDE